MKSRLAVVVSVLLLTTSPLLACEINGLTEAIDRLKRGDEPNASSVTRACVNIMQNRDVEEYMGQLILILHATFDNDQRLKESIRNCPVDLMQRAC
jgi:hypothetical protein